MAKLKLELDNATYQRLSEMAEEANLDLAAFAAEALAEHVADLDAAEEEYAAYLRGDEGYEDIGDIHAELDPDRSD